MKVLQTIEGGFAKEIFEADKESIGWFLKGFQFACKRNLSSPEVIGVLRALVEQEGANITAREAAAAVLGINGEIIVSDADLIPNNVHWAFGILSAIDSKAGKLEVIE